MKYFKFSEFIKSDTASRYGIDNTPTDEIADNILLTGHILDDVREKWTVYCKENYLYNPALIITSGYRCPELNARVGGSPTSAHQTGNAADIVPANGEVEKFYQFFAEYLQDKDFDQLILERARYTEWVHFGRTNNKGQMRRKIMTLYPKNQ